MDRNIYYEGLKKLAHEKRELHKVETAAFGLREVKKIYKAEGITIDYWPYFPSKIKALYMCSDGDFSVAIKKTLPMEPKLFALIHELKHHYTDQNIINSGVIHCGDYNNNEKIEIGAEVFAAEFIYPEVEFSEDANSLGISNWQARDVVTFKKNCKAKVSYQYLVKRLEWLGYIRKGQFRDIKFKKLENEIFGVPCYLRNPSKVG